jgi:hypothetical protein
MPARRYFGVSGGVRVDEGFYLIIVRILIYEKRGQARYDRVFERC